MRAVHDVQHIEADAHRFIGDAGDCRHQLTHPGLQHAQALRVAALTTCMRPSMLSSPSWNTISRGRGVVLAQPDAAAIDQHVVIGADPALGGGQRW
ncbi:MAG: hypothetical protein ACWGG5_01780 [Stenotrophomonas sp.]